MNESAPLDFEPIVLPSDQDASGRTLDREEIDAVTNAIRSGTLTSTKGRWVKQLETDFSARLGSAHAHATTSGTSALHTAIAALDLEPGDEIITTPITDMGAITPILYQGAIPVFVDVDPKSYNITEATIHAGWSDRTRAIMVTHLFGNPCDVDPITKFARERNVPIIEDCAQAFDAVYRGRRIGTIGDIGCFSFQQGKHITSGEGGIVVTNNSEYARRMFLFINKGWGYGDQNPDHYFLAPNYRMNELTGAVLSAQLGKLTKCVRQRVSMADRLTEKLQGLPGVETPQVSVDSTHTYWKYCLWVDQNIYPDGTDRLAGLLKDRGIFSAPRYIQKPAFKCQVISEQKTFGQSRWPFSLASAEALDYADDKYAGVYQALVSVLVLPWNEYYREAHVDYIATAIHTAVGELQKEYA